MIVQAGLPGEDGKPVSVMIPGKVDPFAGYIVTLDDVQGYDAFGVNFRLSDKTGAVVKAVAIPYGRIVSISQPASIQVWE